jgi:hypothetical protein
MTDGSWTETFVKVSGAWPPPPLLDDELELELGLALDEPDPSPPQAASSSAASEAGRARARSMGASVPETNKSEK